MRLTLGVGGFGPGGCGGPGLEGAGVSGQKEAVGWIGEQQRCRGEEGGGKHGEGVRLKARQRGRAGRQGEG